MSYDGFDWRGGDVVLESQPRTAVFLNEDGAVIVRQQDWPEADQSVLIQPQNAVRFVLAVLAAAGHDDIELVRSLGGGGYQDVIDEPPRPGLRQENYSIDAIRTERPDLNIDKALADFDQKMATKDRTAAERQRRCREKQRQRDIVAEDAVTQPEKGGTARDSDDDTVTTAPMIPEFDLQNGGPKALAN